METKIKQSTFNAIIAHLMWISRETLDLDRLLTHDEYLEFTRKIFDKLSEDVGPLDYNAAEEAWLMTVLYAGRRRC